MMSEFSVKFRGVRGSFPVANKDFYEFGGNTSCVEVNVGGHLIILDAGTGIISVGDELIEKSISSSINLNERTPIEALVLLSHIHQDHIIGLTFFKPLHLKSTKLMIMGAEPVNMSLSDCLSDVLFGRTFPVDLGDIAGGIDIRGLKSEQAILLKSGQQPKLVNLNEANQEDDDVLITFYKSYVHPQDGVMIYKISYKGKSLVYATDKECYFGGDKKFVHFAKNCDLLIHDTQYTTEDYLNPHSPKQGYGHSTYDMAIEVMKQAKARKLAFFHFDPSYNDIKLGKIKEHYTAMNKNVYLPYEGMEIPVL